MTEFRKKSQGSSDLALQIPKRPDRVNGSDRVRGKAKAILWMLTLQANLPKM